MIISVLFLEAMIPEHSTIDGGEDQEDLVDMQIERGGEEDVVFDGDEDFEFDFEFDLDDEDLSEDLD